MSNTTFLDTYLALRVSSEAERKQRERERQALLNTMALAEAELAKPEYFGFLIEKDRMGYLEALSQTKTTFRGLNPHDPLNGIVANGGINPDFIMMLEKNFFKENSENLDKDELYFVRYQAGRNNLIKWLRKRFEILMIDRNWLKKEIGISQEDLLQRLEKNSLIFSRNTEDGKVYMVDVKSYLQGLAENKFYETMPQNFCPKNMDGEFRKELDFFADKEREYKERENAEKTRNDRKISLIISLIIAFCLITIFLISMSK